MYSPKRTERNDTSHGALTPIVHVLKNAQSNASKEFDRFYDNLWSRLTPTNSRTKKRTPERMPQYRRDGNSRTSLTPLIERHSLREDARYEYSIPYYQDNESIVAETPVLERAETPMSYDSPIQQSPRRIASDSPQRSTLHSPQRPLLHSPQRFMLHSGQRSMASPRRSTLNSPRVSTVGSSNMMHRLTEERKRMDRLQANVTKIKRQSSYLAEEPSFRLEKEPTSELNKHHQSRLSSHQLATPPQSIDSHKNKTWSKRQRSPSIERSTVKRIAVSPTPSKRMATSPTPNNRMTASPTANNRMAVSISPPRRENVLPTRGTPGMRVAVSPKRTPIENLPKLRSTQMISTPGGSIVSNRFWKEIHGLDSPKDRRVNTSSWANDDDFWSAESAPIPSTFNNKLFQVAQQEEIQKKKHKEQIENDMQWSIETPVSSKINMFSDVFSPSSLSQEIESAQKRDAIIKRNNIPVMNPDLLAQLKSVHRAKLIDDSDSYKFT